MRERKRNPLVKEKRIEKSSSLFCSKEHYISERMKNHNETYDY